MGILNTVIRLLCHPGNRGGARNPDDIRYLVYHYTGNDGDRAVNNAKYYQSTVVGASAHYFVDDEEIYQSVGDLFIAWAVGGRKWSDCRQTGGGSLYGMVTNANSISIEMCDTVRDGRIMASEATLERAAALGRELMEKYDIPVERVVRHFDVTGKHCPAYLMDETAWVAFKGRLKAGEEKGMKQYRYVKDMPEWAQDAVAKAIRAGVVRMDEGGACNVWECNLQPLVWMERMGLLDKLGK